MGQLLLFSSPHSGSSSLQPDRWRYRIFDAVDGAGSDTSLICSEGVDEDHQEVSMARICDKCRCPCLHKVSRGDIDLVILIGADAERRATFKKAPSLLLALKNLLVP
jgi:hypothetical protein